MAMPIVRRCVDWLVAAKMPNGDQQNWDKQFPAMPIVPQCVDWLVAAKMPNGDQQNWDKQFPAMPIICQCANWLVAAYMLNGDQQKWDEQFPEMPIVCWQDDCWTISNFCRSIAFQTYAPRRSLINVDCCFDIWTYKNPQPFQWRLPIDCQVNSDPEFWESMCTPVHFKWIRKVDCCDQW